MFFSISRFSGLATLLTLTACAGGSGQARVGTSADVELEVEDELTEENSLSAGDATEESDAETEDSTGSAADKARVDKTQEDKTQQDEAQQDKAEEPREASLARTALHQSSPPDNHMGLKMAVSERASDLPWVLAIENQSPHPVKLAAVPTLLSAEITPAPDSTELEGKTTKAPEVITCGGKDLPKSLGDDETVELGPGQLLFHSFDPRQLCKGEAPLKEGAKVKLTYGFPIQTKKLWKGGKLTTVEVEQKAPFVAEREPTDGDEIVPLKHLVSEEFTLGDTYPLSEVAALPPQENADGEKAKEPLQVTISPLGTSSSPEKKVVEVRVRNTSGKKMTLLLRRELFTYEVLGPGGGSTCQMYPTARHPAPSAFSSLAPGESRTLQTRLAEACPSGTWDKPGTYAVAALYKSSVSGEEHGLSAFTGSAATSIPARLVVPGDDKNRPSMRIVSSQPSR